MPALRDLLLFYVVGHYNVDHTEGLSAHVGIEFKCKALQMMRVFLYAFENDDLLAGQHFILSKHIYSSLSNVRNGDGAGITATCACV